MVKVLPVAGQSVLLEVSEWEREGMVDADESGNVAVEFLPEPLSETTASPIPAWAGRGLNLSGFAGTVGHEYTDALAGRVGGTLRIRSKN